MVKGKIMYVPKDFVIEFDELKKDFNCVKDSDCFKLLAKSSRLGRELKNIMRR